MPSNLRSANGFRRLVATGVLVCAAMASADVVRAEPTLLSSSSTLGRAIQAPSSDGGEAFRYRLGPGDRLSMSVFKMEGYSANVEVLSDGTINLPRLGTVDVWGLTLEEAKAKITAGYNVILRRPLVYLDLLEARPIRVTVTGQVSRPGVFSLPSKGLVAGSGWPTLVDVVRQAGGVSASADLSSVEVLRPSPRPGGKPQTYRFDYLTVLREGGHAPNPLIYDGDSIRILQSDDLENADLITTATSNFAPATIQVNVVGEVARPGVIEVPSNAPLSGAVLAAGGITRRGSENTVDLIRMNSEGEPKVTSLKFDPTSVLSSASNPPLRYGDVVVVNRNQLTKVTDGLEDAFQPLNPILNVSSIFRLLGLPMTGLLGL